MSALDLPRSAGVLLHITSLPGPHGAGDLGAGARQFLTWLCRAGMRWWQVLPLVPPGGGWSPYSSWSAFAMNPWLMDLAGLVRDGLLDASELAGPHTGGPIDWDAVVAFKGPRLERAACRLLDGARGDNRLRAELDLWRADSAWVDDAALYSVLRARYGGPWWTWPTALRDRDPAALAAAAGDERVGLAIAVQFLVDRQWRQLKAEANARGVQLVGDMPIYVDAESADVWANQALFQLNADGSRPVVAGVPPDAFSETGQLWGNPLYRWDRMAADGFRWWIARLRRALAQCDVVRIDHFRAFAAYWAVPGGDPDARGGAWVPGPGVAFFEALSAELGPLPLVAEDLGLIDAPVRALLKAVGLPGMKVLQFAFGGGADNLYLPHNHVAKSVVYTGTHDNDTTRGYWSAAPEHVKDHVRRYFATDGRDIAWTLTRAAMLSVADLAIVPMQDVLDLGTEARMNTPSQPQGNWRWRLTEDGLREGQADRLRELVWLSGRGQNR